MIRVLCVKWGDKYGPEYVTRLRRGVQEHLPIEHEFICLTEDPVSGVDCEPLPCDLPSWWAKLGLFRPGLFAGENFYLDLDVIITASLLPLVELLERGDGLWARDDFSYPLRRPRTGLDAAFKRLLGGAGTINSSAMLWRGDVARAVWDTWDDVIMGICHGDQNRISQVLYPDRISFIPDELVHSYKYHVLRGEEIAPVVVFHGQPKPHELSRDDPLRLAWAR